MKKSLLLKGTSYATIRHTRDGVPGKSATFWGAEGGYLFKKNGFPLKNCGNDSLKVFSKCVTRVTRIN